MAIADTIYDHKDDVNLPMLVDYMPFLDGPDGNPIDITDGTITFIVKENQTDPDASAVIDKDIIVHTNPSQGESKLVLNTLLFKKSN